MGEGDEIGTTDWETRKNYGGVTLVRVGKYSGQSFGDPPATLYSGPEIQLCLLYSTGSSVKGYFSQEEWEVSQGVKKVPLL